MTDSLQLTPSTSALLVMDFQNAIVENNAPEAGRAALLANAAALLRAARAAQMAVIHVMVGFRPGHPEVSARNRLFSAARQRGLYVLGDPGTAIHAEVAPIDGEAVVVKHRVGAFSDTDLATLLRARNVDTLVLAGIATSGVVLSTVRTAFDLDYRLVVVRDACADADDEQHRVLLDKVFAKQAEVVLSAQVVQALAATAHV